MKILQKIVLSTGIFCLLFIIFPSDIKAATFDLAVNPSIFQIELNPPAIIEAKKSLTIENLSDTPLTLSIQYRPFKPKDESGIIEYLPREDSFVGADPLIFQRIHIIENNNPIEQITLAPKQTKKLDLKMTIPKDEPPSDYYFAILFLSQEETSDSLQSSYSNYVGGIGVSVLLSIGPKKETTGKIEEFSTSFFHEKSPVPFTVRIRNTSQHFIYPKGQITIKNMFGQTIGIVDLLPVNILANSIRALPSKENFIFAAQKNRLNIAEEDSKSFSKEELEMIKQYEKIMKNEQSNLSISPKAFWNGGFLLGPYSATLTVALSDQGPLLTRTIHFFALPIYLIITFFIVIAIVLFIRQRLNKIRTKVS
ncbi:MAG: hypothetical protein KatS3mg089_0914 [Patescibacteria group bacterium]|nr:MAG: hypothetical protein KatS3mg089_0914 [Patescibacteria group bacterium]